ncbi:MAG TPA: protein kinase [Candidatus Limnocylindrales bacterium]|nr:protein kinase [Candidatus Limnocylindrales bacterium]
MAKSVLFGRYRLLDPLGSGGSAQVWRATDKRTGDTVAVKRLHPLVFADAAGRERLVREFRALRDLDEPHIVRVRDLELTDEDGALILDYVAGPSLATRLAGGERMSTAEAVQIAMDVAAALAAAHAAGIVHRDVTPGNILLDPGDGARLTDFGIALGGAGTDLEPALTATGELVGTLRYLAPEQLRGAPATPASDVHALAAVAYEMLAGRPAYEAATPVALAEAHARPVDAIAGIPPALDEAVRRALAPDPADRPADAAAFAAELATAIAADRTQPIAAVGAALSQATSSEPVVLSSEPMWEPVAAAPTSRPEAAAGDPARARRLPAIPIAAALLLLVAGVVLAAALEPSAAPAGDAARPSASAGAPAATPAPTPTPNPAANDEDGDDDGRGKGNDNGKGKGKDKDD